MILGLLIPLFFLLVIVLVARKLFGRNLENAPSSFSIRRLFQYGLLFGLLVVAATGLVGLIGRIFGAGDVLVESQTELARDITFTIIGLPLYLVIGRWTQRSLNKEESERRSMAWSSYLTVVLLTALISIMTATYQVLIWAFGEDSFKGDSLARILVWGLIWIAHWSFIESLDEEQSRVHYIAGALVGLSTLAFGIGSLLADIAKMVIESDEKSILVQSANPALQSMALILVGLPVWYQYWLKKALQLKREIAWYSYVLLAGVAGGFITLVASISVMIFDFLVWYLGETNQLSMGRHFSSSANALGAGLVGLLVWWYHAGVVNAKSAGQKMRDEVRRVYEYIVSGISLIAAAAGFMMIIVAIIESLTPGEVVSTTSSTNTLLAAVTLLIVGAPIWYFFWMRIESHVIEGGEEQSSPTRRIFLLSLFGVASIAAVVSVLTAVFIFIDDLLNSVLGSETVREMRFALAILLSNAAISWYHWSIYREEREIDVTRAVKNRYIVLVGPRDEQLSASLKAKIGGQIQFWQPEIGGSLDGSGNWDTEEVVELIQATPGRELMILKEKKGLKAIPFTRHG